jgi:hypothetical protein
MTVTATMEMSPGPSWDEKIVPTLRKRTCTPLPMFTQKLHHQFFPQMFSSACLAVDA